MYQEDYERCGGSLICVIMNTIAVISRSAAKTVRIISHDGDTVPFFCPLPVQTEEYDFPQNPSEKRAFSAERGGEDA